ncbi:MAG: cation diffusion facilitator family transporter [Candidatus Omnitrophota bacterium]
MNTVSDNIQLHYGRIRRVLIVILVLNWAVAAAKIIFGQLTHFTSMTADGFHSLSDGASNIIGLIGIHFACQPADKKHPYGRKKYETLFALGIAGLLFIVAFNLFKEGAMRIRYPQTPQVEPASFIIMLGTLLINFFVMRYEYAKGKALKSDILVSDSLHTKADLLTSVSVIAALIVTKLGFPLVDPLITMFIALFIAHSGLDIINKSSHILCDRAAIIDIQTIAALAMKVSGVKDCHRIRTRGREDDIHVDLHVQVAGHMQMDEAHGISHAVEEEIKQNIPGVTDVVVHLETRGSSGNKEEK